MPTIKQRSKEENTSLDAVPAETKEKVIEEIAKLAKVSPSQITIESSLAHDLGLDSLDIAQLVVAIKEQFGITSLNSADLTTVGSVIAFAAKLRKSREEENGEQKETLIWKKERKRPEALYPEGKTIPSVFLMTCERMGNHVACADRLAGEISYRQLKMGVILLAESIRKMPGKHIGIMMPASVAVNAMVLAAMLAGKIPVMINWTLGERNLRSVIERSGIQTTLSSWNFIDRLDNVELNGIDEQLVFFEEIREKFSLSNKVKAFFLAQLSSERILKTFRRERDRGEDTAVILFTSGTESFPKGVPLTHQNLLSNQRAASLLAQIHSSDVLLGALPSFHSFGFSVTGLFPPSSRFKGCLHT